jgi:hypothetical protein
LLAFKMYWPSRFLVTTRSRWQEMLIFELSADV